MGAVGQESSDKTRILLFPVEHPFSEGQVLLDRGKKSLIFRKASAFQLVGNGQYNSKQLEEVVDKLPTKLDLLTLADTGRKDAERREGLGFSPVILHPVYTSYDILDCEAEKKTGMFRMHVKASFRADVSENGAGREVFYQTSLDTILTSRTLYEGFYTVTMRMFGGILKDSSNLKLLVRRKLESIQTASRGSLLRLQRPAALPGKDMLKRAKAAVVTVDMKDSFGSGWVCQTNGYVVTNHHVVGDDSVATIVTAEGKRLKARVVKVNPLYDLALLKTDESSLPALQLVEADSLSEGQTLFAIGTPMDRALSQTVTRGGYSGQRIFGFTRMLQIDVPVNPGNSGGPLLNENGQVVGIVSQKLSGSRVDNIGFAIPATVALRELNLQYVNAKP